MKDAARQRLILCVVSDEQRQHVEPELRFLLPDGNLVFEASAERALERVQELAPSLILVGVDTGTMEAIEFVAALCQRHPRLQQELIVLPGPEDPFPPVHHSLDAATGQSTSKWTDPETVYVLIASRPVAR